MDNREKKGNMSFIVPANVGTGFEFFPGFGWKEFIVTAIGGGIGAVLFLLLSFMPTVAVPVKAIIALVPAIAAFMVARREPSNNSSMLFLMQGLMEFNKKQHRYLYKYNTGDK